VFDKVAGELGKGRFDGRLAVSSGAAGVAAQLRVSLADADIGALITNSEARASSGRVTFHADVKGAGRSPAAFIGSLTGSGMIGLEQARLVGLNPGVFDAVIRAIELGIPTDGSRLREFVSGALDSAGLAVSKASAAIGIAAGQARLHDIAIQTNGADLQATVNVDLADAMLDALLTLDAPPSAQSTPQPAVMVMLKGPLPAPKRSVDTNLLESWLTLRALEQKSKELETMERERAARDAAAAAALSAGSGGAAGAEASGAAAPPKPTEPAVPAPSIAPPPAPAAPSPSEANTTSGEAEAPAGEPPVAATPKPRAVPRANKASRLWTPVPRPLLGAQD
jgi:large subunit ribosomal protein L24